VKPRFLSLCLAEPFRIFFPLGVLVGISGVSLWPLFFSGLHKFYPGIMHARLMIEGFLGAFIIGFLGTAGPRITGTPHFSRGELWTLLGLYAAAVGTHIGEQYAIGDALFLVLLLAFALRMAWRFARRTDMPPPSFVLVGFGFLNAIAGTVSLLVGAVGAGSPRATLLGSLLLHQGFVLDLVLGIGGFLAPRILDLPRPEFPESRTPPPGWRRRAGIAAAVGAVLLGTFVAEALFMEWMRVTGFVRALAAGAFLLSELPLHRMSSRQATLGVCLRVALAALALGLAFQCFWPAQRVAGMHVIFIGGFTLITFSVATRVVLGHSGLGRLCRTRLSFFIGTALLLGAGLALRVAGDFMFAQRGALLSYSSYLWMLAAALWSWRVLPKVRIPDPDDG
jgi:uncharacterized protein involved in response to NO